MAVVPLQLHVNHRMPQEIHFETPNGSRREKPSGGIWTSTWNAELQQSDWIRYCLEDLPYHISEAKWYLMQPHKNCNILQIDSLEDLTRIYKRWPKPRKVISYIYGTEVFTEDYVELDFDAIYREGYDAIHLTHRGQIATRDTYPYSTCNWDCESYVWFKWRFAKVHEIDVPQTFQDLLEERLQQEAE